MNSIYILSEKTEYLLQFATHMNKQRPNVGFLIEVENNWILHLLYVTVFKENSKFITSVYRENMLSGA